MRDVILVHQAERAGALLNPLRIQVLKLLDEPRTCTEVARALGETPQKVYYHVKVLERAGAVEKVEERRVRAIAEGLYQASARSFWLSPDLVGKVGGSRRARDQMSLEFLLSLAEGLQSDVGRLAELTHGDVPSLGLSLEIRLADAADRDRFLREVREAVQNIARNYGSTEARRGSAGSGPDSFHLLVACYPQLMEGRVP